MNKIKQEYVFIAKFLKKDIIYIYVKIIINIIYIKEIYKVNIPLAFFLPEKKKEKKIAYLYYYSLLFITYKVFFYIT